eukprot:415292-Prymnesium_polylepis.1
MYLVLSQVHQVLPSAIPSAILGAALVGAAAQVRVSLADAEKAGRRLHKQAVKDGAESARRGLIEGCTGTRARAPSCSRRR